MSFPAINQALGRVNGLVLERGYVKAAPEGAREMLVRRDSCGPCSGLHGRAGFQLLLGHLQSESLDEGGGCFARLRFEMAVKAAARLPNEISKAFDAKGFIKVRTHPVDQFGVAT